MSNVAESLKHICRIQEQFNCGGNIAITVHYTIPYPNHTLYSHSVGVVPQSSGRGGAVCTTQHGMAMATTEWHQRCFQAAVADATTERYPPAHLTFIPQVVEKDRRRRRRGRRCLNFLVYRDTAQQTQRKHILPSYTSAGATGARKAAGEKKTRRIL
ncbi:hypothetical protein U1Q18_052048 [Sarracenia purpurea var. burkii]